VSSWAKLPSVTAIDQALKALGRPWGKEVRPQVQALLHTLKLDLNKLNDPAWDKARLLDWVIAALAQPQGMRRVINGTGIVIHTNLGRAPLSASMFAGLQDLALGYCNLEYDLNQGKRGGRTQGLEELLCSLTGAEAALAVNNNAASLVLALQALAQGKEVIVSRGELIEIGGSFRIPEILAASGAILREVGSTNKTHLHDYAAAINPNTALLLKVHPSNFALQGFTSAVSRHDLANLARERGILLLEDLGSGLLQRLKEAAHLAEPSIEEALAAAPDLLCFSGDKLLGGPQAGLILGKGELVRRLKTHPLYRAFRLDKLRLWQLENLFRLYARAELNQIPVAALLLRPPEEIRSQGERLLKQLPPCWELAPSTSLPGGGSLPLLELPSWALVYQGVLEAEELHRACRQGQPPLVGRVQEQRFLVDLRCLQPHDEADLLRCLQEFA